MFPIVHDLARIAGGGAYNLQNLLQRMIPGLDLSAL